MEETVQCEGARNKTVILSVDMVVEINGNKFRVVKILDRGRVMIKLI